MTERRQSQGVAIVGEPVPPETVLLVGMATPLRMGVDDPPSGKAPGIATASTSRRFAGATSPRLRCAPRGVEVPGRAWVEERVGHVGVAVR